MKITKVEGIPLSAKIKNPFKISTTKFNEVRALLVKVTTDNGLTGIGESLVRVSPRATKYLVEEMLAPQIINEDPMDVAAIWWKMFSVMRTRGHTKGLFMEAISGVDVAIWDIIGKSFNMPIYKVLHGFGRNELAAYGSSVFIGEINDMLNQCKAFIDKGYSAIKIKLGMGVEKDIEAIKAIREYVGKQVRLMVDCNSIYDAGTAIELGRKLEKYDIFWMEEPVPPYDLQGYAMIRNNQPLRIASGEGEFGIYGFTDLLDTNSLSIIQPDLGRVGGYTEGMRIASLAYSKNISIAPHTGMCSAVNIVASMHYSAAIPNFFMFEFMDIDHPLIDIFSTAIPKPENGVIKMPNKPGLGLELDMEKINRWIDG